LQINLRKNLDSTILKNMGGFMREKEKLIVEKRRPDCVTEVKIGSSVVGGKRLFEAGRQRYGGR